MKLFDKKIMIFFLLIFFFEILSLGAYIYDSWPVIIFILLCLLFIAVTIYKIEFGLFIILAELFIGGKGYLFSLTFGDTPISIRVAFFVIFFGIWLGKKIVSKNIDFIFLKNKFFHLYLALCVLIGWGIINGFFRNSAGGVFFDANAWVFFLLAPAFFENIRSVKATETTIKILFACTLWLSIKTIVVLYLFSHSFVWIGDLFYKWLRDSGVGEITYVSGTLFRIFFQSHIYVLIAWLIVIVYILGKNTHDKNQLKGLGVLLYLSSLTVLISQSRSFWVGGLIGLIFIILIAVKKMRTGFFGLIIFMLLLSLIIFSQLFAINLISGNFTGNLLANRLSQSDEEAAGSSRLNQLKPLEKAIGQHWLLGNGFGAEVTYKSHDPRILKSHPDGWYATYALEWGYLDIWLKLGFIGLIIYLSTILFIILKAVKNKNDNLFITKFALVSGLVGVCATNIFSPYLNHPLGIGYLLLISPIIFINES